MAETSGQEEHKRTKIRPYAGGQRKRPSGCFSRNFFVEAAPGFHQGLPYLGTAAYLIITTCSHV